MQIGPVEPISPAWKLAVVNVLKTGRTNDTIQWGRSAFVDWSTYGYQMEAYPSLIAALEDEHLQGRCWLDLSLKGNETYDFLFSHPHINFPFYCKITLMSNRIQIRILSTHKAEKLTL